jgi:hypothetical protein
MLGVAGLLAAAAPAPAAGQERPYRSGFWVENGVGTGTVRIGCATCEDVTSAYGESSYLRLGGSLSRRALLGAEVFTLLDDRFSVADGDSSIVAENVAISLIVMWYPWSSGVFFKGGAGLAVAEYSVTAPGGGESVATSGVGSGVTFGAGFDVPIFKWLSITANLGIYFTALGDLTVQGVVIDDVIASLFNANFAFTIR